MKQYSNINVYDAAIDRITKVFDEFDVINVMFSGGKDSSVVFHLAAQEARQRNRKIHVTFIDLEAFYKITIEHVEHMFKEYADVVQPLWVCLPMTSPNALSYFEPKWMWWEPDKEDIWVRPMPKHDYVINLKNNPFRFYKLGMSFEEFTPLLNDYYGRTANLLGLRAAESLNRYRSIKTDKTTYKNWHWSTKSGKQSYTMSPIYDWTVEDIWTFYGKTGLSYNGIYDLFYKAGVSIHKMRVDEPFGNEAKAGLNLFRIIEPDTWAKVANRVSGANFGNIYQGNKVMNARYTLPKGHSWKTFTKFLLSTLPDETARHYKSRFIKFIKYWHKVGCPMTPDLIEVLESNHGNDIINTHTYSVRGKGDKEVIKFKRIIDHADGVDNKDDILTWRRMAMCIIKNDINCKSLSFSETKQQKARTAELMEKYRSIL